MRAEVLRRDAAGDREDLAAGDGVLERVRDLLDAELLALEVLLHQRLVGLDDLVEQLLPVLLDESRQLVGDRPRLRLLLAVRARVGAHVEDVDDPGQLVLAADRQLDGDAARRKLLLHLTERAEEVGALPVEHVDEEDARDPELVGALPDPSRPDLDAHDAAEHEQRPLDDAERAARLALKARVAGDVDEVELPVLPLRVRERERDRHPPLLLVVVPVGDRRARLDRAEAVRLARLEEQRLDERGLTRASVADDGDVADLSGLECGHARRPPRISSGESRIVTGCRQPSGTRAAPRRALRRRIAFVCSWETRDSVTPSTSPISRSVSSS